MGGKGGESMKVLYGHTMTRSCSTFWSHSDHAGPGMSYCDSSRNGHIMTSGSCSIWSDGDFPGPGMSDYDSEISWSYYDGVGPARSGYDFAAPGGMA